MKRRSFIRQIIWAGVTPSIIIPRAEAGRSFNDVSISHFRVNSCPFSTFPFSLSIWINKPSIQFSIAFVVNDTSGTSAASIGQRAATGAMSLRVTSDVNATTDPSGTATAMSNNVWHHIVGVFSSSTSRTAYLNGVLDFASTTGRSVSNLNQVAIGCLFAGATASTRWIGVLADACLYNKALSDAEVAQLYVGGPRAVRSGLVFWSRMTESGDLRDIVGGRTLTAYNSPALSTLHPRTR